MPYSSFTYKIEYKPKVTVDEQGQTHIRAEMLLTQSHEHDNDLQEEAGFALEEVKALIDKTAYFRTNVRESIVDALQCLEKESDCWAELSRLDWDDKKQFDISRPPKHLVETVNEFTEALRKAIMSRLCLHPQSGGSKARHDLTKLGDYYKITLPTVQGAKDFYKKNADRRLWVQMVKLEYPNIPDELIARLSGKAEDLTDEHNRMLAEKGGTSQPSDIALEWAARLCECPRYDYSLAHLYKEKGKQVRANKKTRASIDSQE